MMHKNARLVRDVTINGINNNYLIPKGTIVSVYPSKIEAEGPETWEGPMPPTIRNGEISAVSEGDTYTVYWKCECLEIL